MASDQAKCLPLSLYIMARSWTENGLANAGGSLITEEPQDWEPIPSLPNPLPHSSISAEKTCPLSRVDTKVRKRNLESALLLDSTNREGAKPNASSVMSCKDLLHVHVQHAKRIRIWNEERRMHRMNRYQPRYKTFLPSTSPPHSYHVLARTATNAKSSEISPSLTGVFTPQNNSKTRVNAKSQPSQQAAIPGSAPEIQNNRLEGGLQQRTPSENSGLATVSVRRGYDSSQSRNSNQKQKADLP
eukprot:jgi/Bigna1/72260/fgenesh1_pg.19_\